MEKKDNWKIFKNFIEVISVIILVITFCKTCNNEKEIKGINYKERAITHRPNLYIIGKPKILEIKMPKSDVINAMDSSALIEVSANIKYEIKITNIGNDIANIVLMGFTDTLSGNDEFRQNIFDKSRRKYTSFIKDTTYLFQNDIKPNDTIPFTFTYQAKYFDKVNDANGSFTLHLIVFYQNKIGNLYDTYYWAKYLTKPFYLTATYSEEKGQGYITYKWIGAEVIKSFECIATANNAIIYNENNRNKLVTLINSEAK